MSSRAKSEVVKKGERVKARWSGSNVFYDAKVVEVFSKSARVQFDDGSISSVKIPDIKKITGKSEKSPSPKEVKSKSRSRSRSTGRPRSRSRSPARKEKKTSEKKSASKVAKKTSEEESNSVSRDEIDSISKTPLTREKIGLPKHESTTIKSTLTVNSFSSESVEQRDSRSGSERIRSARIAALRSAEANRSLFVNKDKENRNAKEKAKYSDDEEEEEVVPVSISNGLKAFYFFVTLLRIILLPATLLFLAFACTKRQCTLVEFPQFYSKWRDFINSVKNPIGCIILFHALQCILSLIPLGTKVTSFVSETKKKSHEYRLNGLLCLSCNIVIFGVCAYFEVYTNWGYDKFRPIALSSALYCIFFSVVLHIYTLVKGGETASSRIPYLGNFYNGSYQNPFFFKKVDLKTSFIRSGLIGAVILNLSIVLKYFLMKGHVSIPLAITSSMHIFFVLDLLFREEKLLSTATYTTDTFGYSSIMTFGFLVPIGLTLPNIYLFNYDAKASLLPHWCSASIAVLFILGYYIFLTSSNLKHNFRKNPFAPSLAGVESIPTSKKRRLVSSGLWGLVRHPNYLGLLIMAVAWTLPCGFTHVIPFGPLALLFVGLLVRVFRIEAECKDKYGPAWKNYTDKVRNRLIPYIF